MIDNPYVGIIDIMRKQGSVNNPPSISLGTVLSINPLSIKTGDLVLDADDLLVSHHLLDNYVKTGVMIQDTGFTQVGNISTATDNTSGGTGENSFSSHNHTLSSSSTVVTTQPVQSTVTTTFETCLAVNDIVVMIPSPNSNDYIVFSKVVRP